MKRLLLAVSFLVLVVGLAACAGDPSVPSISGAGNVTLEVGESFDPLAGVSASDENDGDLTADIAVSGSVNVDAAGTYTLTYSVENSDGESASVTRTVTVEAAEEEEPEEPVLGDFVPASGVYDFKFAPIDLKHQFFAAAERFLVERQAGGIPLWASSSFNLFSDRMQLPTEGYDPVMGFGIAYAQMSGDDSTVIMDDGQLGEAGEYTYRTRITENPPTLQQWIYEDSISSDVISTFLDSLYFFNYNSDFSGFELQPSMAASLPTPINSEEVFGSTVSNTWSVPVRDGLVWTDHTGAEAGDITAQDFLDTYKLAVDEGWFRAISGGGDFLNPAQEIVNMQAYVDGDVEWDEVGISVEGNNIVFEFVPLMSEWNVIYWLSSFVMTPINLDLYEEVGDQYGTSAETTSYSGRFYLETYEADRILRLKENPNFHDPNRTFYTGYTFEVINDSDIAFQSFISGRLDATGLPASRFDEYQSYPGIRFAPGATVFRMNMNSHGTVESQREQFPDSTLIPEPILAYQDFRTAMYFGIDRNTLAYDVVRTAEPAQFYFTPAYLVDPAGGVPFRDTEYGPTVLEGFSPSTSGYNPDAAKALFDSAVEDAVAAGEYAQGDVIELLLIIAANSQVGELAGEFIESSMEDLFVNEEYDISVDVVVQAEPFPNNYFNWQIPGETDLGFGGISGSQLDAAGFLDTFNSLNTSGFTLNWGPDFDTTQADIEIEYVNPSTGETLREVFSFDAIQRLLTSEVELEDGEVVE